VKDQPLKAEVEGDRLVVSIGVKTLAWASQHRNGGVLKDCRVDPEQLHEFSRDVTRAMCAEDELGATPLCNFLEDMI
jgi:hypothetical protein